MSLSTNKSVKRRTELTEGVIAFSGVWFYEWIFVDITERLHPLVACHLRQAKRSWTSKASLANGKRFSKGDIIDKKQMTYLTPCQLPAWCIVLSGISSTQTALSIVLCYLHVEVVETSQWFTEVHAPYSEVKSDDFFMSISWPLLYMRISWPNSRRKCRRITEENKSF